MPVPIKGFIPHSLLDWEGKIASVVFLAGCNMRCPYCHACHLVMGQPTLERIPTTSVLAYLNEHADWVDGVVISGGEPTIHEGLGALIDAVRAPGPAIKLDTNGTRPDVVEALVKEGKLDYVAMDVKAPLDERYAVAAGGDVDLAAIRRSIELLMRGEVDYEFRTTVCSALHDEHDLVDMAGALTGAKRWILQPFRPLDCIDPQYRLMDAETPESVTALGVLAGQAMATVTVRGVTR